MESVSQDAHPPPGGRREVSTTPEQAYRYPNPVELARKRAERTGERADWGAVGGLTTLYRHGAGYFRLLALRRWGQ